MKTTIALLALAFVGCSTTATPAREKQIAKLESRGWNVLGVVGGFVERFLIGTASNLAAEHMRADPSRVGLRK